MADSWQEEFDEEKTKLKKFIMQKKPHVIVLAADAASGRDTRQVRRPYLRRSQLRLHCAEIYL